MLRGALIAAALLVATALLVTSGAPVAAVPDRPAVPHPTTFTNPVSASFADTFADPAVIRGKDGLWYAFGTSDPLLEGERVHHLLPIASSRNLVDWQYRGDAFGALNRPAWATGTAGLWAPDIRYADGRYLLYFTVTDTTLNPGDDSAIGVATAPTPLGPWTDSGGPVVAPRPGGGGGFQWTFDPSMLTGLDGQRWLYYGSYYGGIYTVPLTADGLRVAGPAVQVTIDNRYEGAYVIRRGGWYYLFASAANCCAGPTTGYSVFAGRSRQPTGPFVDRDGVSLLTSRVGGTPVIQPNGNAWIGTGHNAVVTDAAGQDWLAYHAIHRSDPFLDEPYGINERPMLLDRLDWIDGWPVVRAGAWASEGPVEAPVAQGRVADAFETGSLGGDWLGSSSSWAVVPDADPDSGGLLRHTGSGTDVLVSTADVHRDVYAEADVRLGSAADAAAGLAVRLHPGVGRAQAGAVRTETDDMRTGTDDTRYGVVVRVDRGAGALVAEVAGGQGGTAVAGLPGGFRYDRWHSLSVRVVGRQLTAELTDARLGDPVAEVALVLPAWVAAGRLGLVARGLAEFDNVSAAAAARPVTRSVAVPRVGRLDPGYSDEFDSGLDGWTWVRPDPAAAVTGGVLRWPTQAADLVGGANQASVLVREAPAGDYVVETKVAIDLGVDTVRNYQQAGLIAYATDDDFARLAHVAIWNTRQAEYGRELPFAGRLSYGGMVLGPPADVTWLRLAHSVDRATGEHEFRAASSRDGQHWIWGGTWTFPAGAAPRIGLISHGGNTPQATAQFDYVRVYR